MKILVIEDTQEEREKAQKVLESAGHEAIVVSERDSALEQLADGVDGVITDLFFDPNPKLSQNRRNAGQEKHLYGEYTEDKPAAGLTIVIAAMQVKTPVVVCTSGNHHGQDMAWIYDNFIMNDDVPLGIGWVDDDCDDRLKDWDMALEQLMNLKKTGQRYFDTSPQTDSPSD